MHRCASLVHCETMPKGLKKTYCSHDVVTRNFGLIVPLLCPQLAGLALTAECIYFVTDQEHLYPLLYATGNDDLFAAAWIGIFTGFCFFLLAILGIVGIMQSNRRILMAVGALGWF